MTSNIQVYNDIYDIVKDNMESADKKIPYTKDTFIYSTRSDLKYVDMFDLVPFDNESFIESLYVGLFYRLIDDSARANWDKDLDMIKTDFQRKVVQQLTSSREFMQNNANCINNIYAQPSRQFSINISTATSRNIYIDKLYHLYMKLPAWFKNFIKKILARFK